MKKIKQLFTAALTKMGYTSEDIDKMFPEADGVEPILDADAFLVKAQEYAKPLIKPSIVNELKASFKGQYLQEAAQKISDASGGLLKREDVDGKTVEEVMTLYNAKLKDASGMKETEKDTMIANLNTELAKIKTDHEAAINSTKAEYEGKENKRSVQDQLLAKLSAKKMTVPATTALKAVLTELENKYTMKVEDGKIAFYDKEGNRLKNANQTNFLDAEELINPIITEYNWDKQSNGGEGGAASGLEALNLPQRDGKTDMKAVSPTVAAAIKAGLIPEGAK